MRILCRLFGHRMAPVFIESTPRIERCRRCGCLVDETPPMSEEGRAEIRRIAESLGYHDRPVQQMSLEDARLTVIWAEAHHRYTSAGGR